jgi:RNA polymerase sigma-54 factor
MLAIVQSLDPPGVGARDLRECLMLQLREAGLEHSVPFRLVRDCFDELIAHRWSEISKRFGISPGDVQKAADEIAKLDPKPGLVYSDAERQLHHPDLIVDKIDGKYHVFLNDANLPRLKLSKAYQEIARDKKKFDGENKEFISNKLNSANWMIQAIEQRRQTMLKVMNYIVERQREFFEKGVQYLKPLTLREVAEVISMHESTVSRVTNEKFVQTPRGVLPLKFFFSSGLSTTAGEDVSARGIKAQIQKLVSEENPKHPLTDQAIVNILKETGVQIARRTVAKYRDQLGVLPRRMRKRYDDRNERRRHAARRARTRVDVSASCPQRTRRTTSFRSWMAAQAFAAIPDALRGRRRRRRSVDDSWEFPAPAAQYPFLRAVRHRSKRGIADALRTGY